MISVEQALDKILSNFHTLPSEKRPILECLGQVLSSDVSAGLDVPPHDNSAMDGYAVLSEDISTASVTRPVSLTVIGEIAAGYVPVQEIRTGTAIRIMTGAPMPPNANAVVPFEYTDESSRKASNEDLSRIGILHAVKRDANVRHTGEDIAKGALVLEKGTVLSPSHIGLLASLGQSFASVVRRPVVSVLTTGDELIDIGQPLPNGKIYNSNAYSIAAQVIQYGGIPSILNISRDTFDSLNKSIDKGIESSDLLITSGGVSVGDYDVVKDVLAERGTVLFWTVKMKPGKPLAFGVLKQTPGNRLIPHIGLPGNPVSSMITFEQFVRPSILKMLGKQDLAKPCVEATIQNNIKNSDGRRIYARVFVTKHANQYHASLTGPQGSGILTSMAMANGLAIIPEDTKEVWQGDRIQVQMLDWG
ncbi:MAG: molybdopterin molybdotransferase MoeA [Chloroflexota bacterium]|nr:molybdopterin molybdotransferase MoeA [Chloroflexota bacterium]